MRRDVSIKPVKHPRYKWRVTYRYTDEEGNTGRRQAYFVKRGEADAFAAEKAVEIANHGSKHGHVDDEERLALMRFRQWAAKRSDAPSLATLIERGITAHEASRPPLTVAQAVEARIDAAEKRGLSAAHIADLGQRLRRFARDFGERQIADVRGAEIEAWLHRNTAAAQTWHNFARIIGSAFELAVKRGYLQSSPVGKIDRPKITRKAPSILKAAELRRLLDAASPDIRPMLVLQSFCGVRRAEANRLRWEHIHLDGESFVELPSEVTKTNRRRTVALPKCAVEWLRLDAGLPGASLGLDPGIYRERLRSGYKSAGIPWDNNLLRHSFGTYRLASTRNATLVAEEMGNSVGVVRVHYANVASPEAAAAWWKVEPATAGRVIDFAMEKSS